MFTPRETIMAALFALLQGAAGFNHFGRRVLQTIDVPDQPALFVRKHTEEYLPRKALGIPAITVLDIDIFIYWRPDDISPDVAPETVGNTLIDAVEAVLQPLPGQKAQTLGGLVQHVWIEGKVLQQNGDIYKQAVVIIPVKIMVPC